MRRYALDALVVLVTATLFLVAREAYYTWQRVNALFAWAQQVQASQVQQSRTIPTPEPTKPK